MRDNNVPARLWDNGLVFIAEIQSLLARGSDQCPGIECVMGQTVDISEWLDFDFYDRVWYWDTPKHGMNVGQARISRWLGITHHVGTDMTYWILTEAGHVIARSTVLQHITVSDMATDVIKGRVVAFDARLLTRFHDGNFVIDIPNNVFNLQDNDFNDLTPTDTHDNIPLDTEYGDMLQPDKIDADDVEFETFDRYIGAEFLVNQNGESFPVRVTKRVRDNSGKPVGKSNANPIT